MHLAPGLSRRDPRRRTAPHDPRQGAPVRTWWTSPDTRYTYVPVCDRRQDRPPSKFSGHRPSTRIVHPVPLSRGPPIGPGQPSCHTRTSSVSPRLILRDSRQGASVRSCNEPRRPPCSGRQYYASRHSARSRTTPKDISSKFQYWRNIDEQVGAAIEEASRKGLVDQVPGSGPDRRGPGPEGLTSG